jgi:hypothetical protein
LALDVERIAELQDDPELPMAERLERSADRFELRVQSWGVVDGQTDVDGRVTELERWSGFMDSVLEHPERMRAGAAAFAESKAETAKRGERRKEIGRLHGTGLSTEKRHQRYDDAEAKAEARVIDHHGAALWQERPGNHERFTKLYDALTRQKIAVA